MPILQIDAKALEWYTAVELSQDPVGIEELEAGYDTHELNRTAFSLPSRLISKIYLFRTIFKGNGWSFANDNDFKHVSTDPDYWEEVNVKFYKKYAGLARKHAEWKDTVLSGNPIVGPLGREWLIDIPVPFKVPWTTLSNYPVQGTGADVMLVARLSLYNRLKARPDLTYKFISTVHDSIVIDCPTACVQEIVNIAHSVFDDLHLNIRKIFGYPWRLQMKCECKAGPNMKHTTEIKRTNV